MIVKTFDNDRAFRGGETFTVEWGDTSNNGPRIVAVTSHPFDWNTEEEVEVVIPLNDSP